MSAAVSHNFAILLAALRTRRRLRYHSPSSLEMAGDGGWGPGRGCRRAWALRYLRGLKKPEVPWSDVEKLEAAFAAYKARHGRYPSQAAKHTIALDLNLPPLGAGVRSAALGTLVHTWAEWWCLGDPRVDTDIDWSSLPGQVFHAMCHLLPKRGTLRRDQVEVPWTLEIEGVLFRGKADVLLDERGEVWDHKTTRSLKEWAKLAHAAALKAGTPKRSLRDDLQACLYVLASVLRRARRNPTKPAPAKTTCRWNYGQTDQYRAKRSLPVVQVIETAHSESVVRAWLPRARELEAYASVEEAPANTGACFDYGGCWYRYAGHCSHPIALGRWALHEEEKERAEARKGRKP